MVYFSQEGLLVIDEYKSIVSLTAVGPKVWARGGVVFTFLQQLPKMQWGNILSFFSGHIFIK